MDCIKSSGEVVKKNVENIDIKAKNLIDIAIDKIIEFSKEPVDQNIPIKLNIKINIIKNRALLIEIFHLSITFPRITIGIDDINIKDNIIGLE